MTKKNSTTTEPAEAVEVEAPEVETAEAKPRISRLERARMQLAAAEAKEQERKAKRVASLQIGRKMALDAIAAGEAKLEKVDADLIELIGEEEWARLYGDQPEPLRTWPAFLEHEGKVYKFTTERAFERALDNDVPAALYGSDVIGDVTTQIEAIFDEDQDPTLHTWPKFLKHEGKVYKFVSQKAYAQAAEHEDPAVFGEDVTGDITDDTVVEGIFDEDPIETVEIVAEFNDVDVRV